MDRALPSPDTSPLTPSPHLAQQRSTHGVLAAGVTLDTVQLVRIKNSWGTRRGGVTLELLGYHDLPMAYLDADIPENCAEKATDDERDACERTSPTRAAFTRVIVPAGY